MPSFITDTQRLLNDILTWLIALDIPATAVICGIILFKKLNADEQEGALHMKRLKTTLICGVGILIVSALIKLVFSYYS